MSGTISGINYSLLFNTAPNTTSSLIGALYGGGSGVSGASNADPLTAMQIAQKNETQDIATEAKDPTVLRDVAAFEKGIANAKDLTTALQNPAVLKVVLTANGMSDQVGFTALAVKALSSDPTDPKSLVNQLTDTRWKAATQNLNLAKGGLAALQDPAEQAKIATAYAKTLWQQSLDQQTPGMSNALQFQTQAASITKVDQVLGDPVNRDVVLTALGIPLQIAYQTLPAQENAIASRLDVTRLQDPHYVQVLTQQYLLNKQQSASANPSGSLTALAAQGGGILV